MESPGRLASGTVGSRDSDTVSHELFLSSLALLASGLYCQMLLLEWLKWSLQLQVAVSPAERGPLLPRVCLKPQAFLDQSLYPGLAGWG